MDKVGYSLVDSDGHEVWHHGETKGVFFSAPEAVPLPNGDVVHGASVGDVLQDWRFVERWIVDEPASPWHQVASNTVTSDGTKVIVTVNYEEAATIVPMTVTPRQARLALLGAGLLDDVETAVNAAGGATKITWDYATEVNRTDPLIIAIGASLSLTSLQIDDLFRQASTL
jgi:hypothetical protein